MSMDIERQNPATNKSKKLSKRRHLFSLLVTFINFIAMFLQLAKYIDSQDTRVSGWNKVLMNVIASMLNIYLKFTSHDKEHNNKCHLIVFTTRRLFVLGVFCYFMYIDSKNDFSSFGFNGPKDKN